MEIDKISYISSEKLERIKIGKRTIRDYNLVFNDLLKEIKPNDKPTEARQIIYYIKGLKEKQNIYSLMILKKFDSLKQAMEQALKFESCVQMYEDNEDEYNKSNITKKEKPSKYYNKNYSNNKPLKSYSTKNKSSSNYNKYNTNNSDNIPKPKEESDLDKLTKEFANMSLHVCHRCYQKGHDARICTNELSSENKNLKNQYNEFKNNLN